MAEKLKQMHRKKILLMGGILLVAFVAGLCVQKPEGIKLTPLQPAEELKLYDFPEDFKDSTLIVVGDNASDIEMQAANEIAYYLENETGNKPLIKKHSEISDEDKRNYNLIVVDMPKTNLLLEEVYAENTENKQIDNANFSIKAKKYSSTLTITNTGDVVLTNIKIIKLTGFAKEGGAMYEEIIKLIPELEIGKNVNVSIPEISSCGFLPDQSHVYGFNPPPEKELDILSGKLMYSEGRIIVTCDQGIEKSIVFCEIKQKSDILEFFAFYILPPVLAILLIIGVVRYIGRIRGRKK